MMPETGDEPFKAAFLSQFLPAALAFGPQFVLISAGFDAHRDDPLAALNLSNECYGWMTRQAKALARRCLPWPAGLGPGRRLQPAGVAG